MVGIVFSLAFAIALQRHAIETFDWSLSWPPLVAAVCLLSLGPLAGGSAFWLLLRSLAPSARFAESLSVWERSFAARYVPSGALTVAVRIVDRRRLGASRAQMLSATAFEHLVAAAGAAAVSLAAFGAAGRRPPLAAVVVLAVFLALAPTAPWLARWWSRRRAPAAAAESVVVRSGALAGALALSSCSWLVAGAAAWLVIESMSTEQAPGFFFLLGAYTFAWLIGFLVPFAPSGLGAREATLIALLAPSVGAGPATALSLALRLANVAGDLLAIGAVEAAWLLARRCRVAWNDTPTVRIL